MFAASEAEESDEDEELLNRCLLDADGDEMDWGVAWCRNHIDKGSKASTIRVSAVAHLEGGSYEDNASMPYEACKSVTVLATARYRAAPRCLVRPISLPTPLLFSGAFSLLFHSWL